MSSLTDAEARQAALDPGQSFIVQAPAGSGKTELLIQRHLRLLALVRAPEQIVAVTFTRKAAAEMRTRLIAILSAAAEPGSQVEPHRVSTLALARRVVERDRELDWGLLERPGRIRIGTVDALNAWLADRLPILAGGVSGGKIYDNSSAIYLRAATNALDFSLSDDTLRPSARLLLGAADNSLEKLTVAFAAVLPMRDQWHKVLAEQGREFIRNNLESALKAILGQKLSALRERIGERTCLAIADAMQHAVEHSEPGGDLFQHIECTVFDDGPIAEQFSAWQGAATLLLTGTGQWRRRLTKRQGFHPKHRAEKEQVSDVIAELAKAEGMEAALASVTRFPPLEVSAVQLDTAVAAVALLRQALAELAIIFQTDAGVDYLELALSAQRALGAVDAPSELLLALDQRIEHILVDEFQDTSHSQFRLLELLTAGWTNADGRTLFLVGDPMQSIYRFRDADMSLFLRAKEHGIGSVTLGHLVLTSNFRSAPTIVGWINETFAGVFPSVDDVDAGTTRYYPFNAERQSGQWDAVHLHRLNMVDQDVQQQLVADIAANELKHTSTRSVAILVQSRSHLIGMRKKLQTRGVATRAVDIETIAEQSHIQDLLALTRAVLHLGDRVAWLALLRAPWCGLTWSEIHTLCADSKNRCVWELLHDKVRLAGLPSESSRERVEFLIDRLERGLALRGRYSLPRWIECCWQLLDGPATLSTLSEVDQARTYFRTLGGICRDGEILDPVALTTAFDVPIGPEPAIEGANAVEVMTIHRAKGLEFDVVILFGLNRGVRQGDAKAIHWRQTHGPREGLEHLLFAALAAGGDPLTRYMQNHERELDHAERARLLYVAVTRARECLHLVGSLELDEDGAGKARPGSLMSLLEAPFALEAAVVVATEEPVGRDAYYSSRLEQLADSPNVPLGPLAANAADGSSESPQRYEWVSPAAVHVGTVVHRALQRLGRGTKANLTEALGIGTVPIDAYRRELVLLGVPERELDSAASRVRDILIAVASDPMGQWILAPHMDAESEVELSVNLNGALAHYRLDRTFVDESGIRWIVDYKTSFHSGGDLAAFLDAEVERYCVQLEQYGRAMAAIDPRPTELCLYFPMLREHRKWRADISPEVNSEL
jgi:ATP-dependent helicase/nuclease subunit A